MDVQASPTCGGPRSPSAAGWRCPAWAARRQAAAVARTASQRAKAGRPPALFWAAGIATAVGLLHALLQLWLFAVWAELIGSTDGILVAFLFALLMAGPFVSAAWGLWADRYWGWVVALAAFGLYAVWGVLGTTSNLMLRATNPEFSRSPGEILLLSVAPLVLSLVALVLLLARRSRHHFRSKLAAPPGRVSAPPVL